MGLGLDIVLVVLLVIGFILYFSAKKQLRQGNRSGWLKWAEPYVNVARAQSVQTHATAVQPNVLGALDDLYREFMEETAGIREETAVLVDELRKTFEDRITQLEAAVERLADHHANEQLRVMEAGATSMEAPAVKAAASVAGDVAGAPTVVSTSEQAPEAESEEERLAARRFEILDLLAQGFSPEAIASRLSVGVTEVQLVEKLMKHPGNGSSPESH